MTQIGGRRGHIETRGEWPEGGSSLIHHYPVSIKTVRHIAVADPPMQLRIVTQAWLWKVRLAAITTRISVTGYETGAWVEVRTTIQPRLLGWVFAPFLRRHGRAVLTRVKTRL